jgi:predicted ATPase/signal transduction histidine kinase
VSDLSSYAFSSLRDGDLKLHRGSGRGVPPILLLTAENASRASLERLEHEYALRAELDAAWAACPVELSQHRNRTALVLEDPGGDPLDLQLGRPLGITEFLRIGISLARALRQVHARGLIHKDIKPANILVDAASSGVWLTGFGIASRLPRERANPEPPDEIAGSLAYMAPEQTGRMNRSIDTRSDLYSLGVTFYETLTGMLPFTAADPMEWVHCHIARQPVPPDQRTAKTPRTLSAIVMKLLAKTAEERYQTAAGVEADLRRCLAEWESRGRIDPFPLGARDASDRLLIPERLYGREREIESLLACFDRVVAHGTPELVLVSGYSGIGKSSVVNELHKALVPSRGLYASGKFDQYKRDIPYATLAQAFQSLVRSLLSRSESQLGRWRDSFGEALGSNGQLIVNLVPELALIIGEQLPVTELPPQEAKNRFQMVFRRFLGVFARQEHPLALFLDDLQWLDSATLDLLEHLITHAEVRHLLLVGAYRDNEVGPSHPLIRTLEALREADARVHAIVLAPLGLDAIGRLVIDALHCEPEHARSLAQLVHQKAGGNPFFAIQFLIALADEGLLAFDSIAAVWAWDINRIRAKNYTDNVVDLMLGKLKRLSGATQTALRQLACLGNVVEIATLSLVFGRPEAEIHTALLEAVQTGLIFRLDRSYAFLHDRVQEAAYALIPEGERAAAHLRIGRVLASLTAPEAIAEKIFEIVNQLDRGAALITALDEREQLAELNLLAGRRAKASTAYVSALTYLIAGAALMQDDSWERRHELIFQLELHRAECEFLTGALTEAEKRLTELSTRAANTVEQATVTCLRVDVYLTLDQSGRAVTVGLDYLRDVGVDLPAHPSEDDARREYNQTWSQVRHLSLEDFVNSPLMSDAASLATLDVLTKLFAPANFTSADLVSVVLCTAVNLSLERGNSDGSCVALALLGMLAAPRFGDYQAVIRLSQLGYELVERRGLKRFQADTYIYAAHVMQWTHHLRTGRDLLRGAFTVASRSGNLTFASFSCNNLNSNLLAAGVALHEVQREAEHGLAVARKARFGLVINIITAQLGLIRTLRGLTPKFGCFDEGEFNELQFEQHFASRPALAIAECWYWIRKLQARFFADDYATAIHAASMAQRLLWTSPLEPETADYHYYAGLSRAARWDTAPPDEQPQHLESLAAHHEQLQAWAANCPDNFENLAALLSAEIARIEGRDLDAMRLYEEASRSARASDFIHNEALANELAGRFYGARGFEKSARVYLQDARYCYLRWGADGKVRRLDEAHPHLIDGETAPGPTSTIGAPVGQLDVEAVVKASQALSSEMVLDKLIEKLMRIAVEHAGAARGLLILITANEPRIAAEARTGGSNIEVTLRNSAVTPTDLSESVLHTAVRTQDSVILDDASAQIPFSADEYVREKHARSVLCLPLVKQGKLIGALYLENNLAPRVFTSAKLALLKLLASQAAISLENVQLYDELRRSEAYLSEAQRLSHTGTCAWRPSSEKVYWTAESFSIFEYDPAITPTLELARRRVHPDDFAAFQQVVERASKDGQDYAHEYRLRMPDERVKYVHVVARAFRDEAGDLEFVGSVMDVSAIRLAEHELHKTQTDLAHVMRVTSLGELTASIAHEVNQPLGAVLINAEACQTWLDHEQPNLTEVHAALERIVRDGTRAGEVIRRVRTLAKKADTKMAPLNLNEVLSEAMTLVQHELSSSRVALRMEHASALPVILADKVQLQQVILNLVINGIEAMQSVTDRPRELVIRSEQDDARKVRVTVTDCGVGFSADNAGQLFNTFFTTKSSGLGMGLSICRSIIELHGGSIWAVPNVPHGATIQFTLPLHPGAAS